MKAKKVTVNIFHTKANGFEDNEYFVYKSIRQLDHQARRQADSMQWHQEMGSTFDHADFCFIDENGNELKHTVHSFEATREQTRKALYDWLFQWAGSILRIRKDATLDDVPLVVE